METTRISRVLPEFADADPEQRITAKIFRGTIEVRAGHVTRYYLEDDTWRAVTARNGIPIVGYGPTQDHARLDLENQL